MRVLQISTTYPPADISGVGTLVLELRRELERRGHQPVVITRAAPSADRAAIALGGRRLTFPLRAAWATWREHRKAPFDVVHVHESDGVVAAAAVRVARLFGLSLGRALLGATLQVSYRRERLAVRPIFANGKLVSRPARSERVFRRFRAPFHALLGRWTARWVDRVVAPSRATARELEEDYGARRVSVIANGVAAGAEPAPRAPTSRTRFLSVGRLRTRKAVGVLLEAFHQLRAGRDDVELVVIGGGELSLAIARQLAGLGTADVRLLGAIDREEIGRHLAAADVFVLPSIYEGFPLAILEAMAAGLPVIATRVAGNPEAVEDGESGLLVEPEDATGLEHAMARLADDPGLRRSMGARGRRILAERFSIEPVSAAYVALWSEAGGILDRAPSGAFP